MRTGAEGRGLTSFSSRSQCPPSRVSTSSQQHQQAHMSTAMLPAAMAKKEHSSHYSLPESITIASLERIVREIEVSAQIAMGEADNVVIAVLARQNASTTAAAAAVSEMKSKKEGKLAAEGASPFQDNSIVTSAEALLNAVTLLATAAKEARAAIFYYNPFVHGRSARMLYLLIDLAVMSYGPLCSPEGLASGGDGEESLPTKGIQGTNLEYYRAEPIMMMAARHDAQKAYKDGSWTRGIQHSNGSSVAFLISRIIAMLEEAKTSVIVYDERAAMAAAAAAKALVGDVFNAIRRDGEGGTSDERAVSAPLNALSPLLCSPSSPPLGGGGRDVFGSTAPPSFSTPTEETFLKHHSKGDHNNSHGGEKEEEEKIITAEEDDNEISEEEIKEASDESNDGETEKSGIRTSSEEPFAPAAASSSLYQNRYDQESPVHVPRESQEVLMSGTTPAHSQNDLTFCGLRNEELKGNNGTATEAGGRSVFPDCYDAKASMAILHRLVDVITRLNALATAEEDHIRDVVMAAMYAEYHHDHPTTPNTGNTVFTCGGGNNNSTNSSFILLDSFASTATASSVNGGYAPFPNDISRNANNTIRRDTRESGGSDYAEVKPGKSTSSILTRLRGRGDSNLVTNDSTSTSGGTRSSNVIQRGPGSSQFTRVVGGRQRALTTTDSRGIPARRGGAAAGGAAPVAVGSAKNSDMGRGGGIVDAFLPLADIAAPNCRKLSFRGVLEDRLRHLYDHLSKLPPSEILSAAGGLTAVVRSSGQQQKPIGAGGTSSFAFSSTPDLAKLSSFASVANAQNGLTAAHPSHSQLASQIHHSFVEESGGGGAGLRSLLGTSRPSDGDNGGGQPSALSGGGVIDGGGTAVLDLQSLWTRAMSRWGLYGFMGRGCIHYLAWWSRQATAVLKNARVKISALPLPSISFAKLPNVGENNVAGLEPSPPLLSIGSPQPFDDKTPPEATGTPIPFMSTAADLGIDAPIPSVHCDVLEAFQAFVSALDIAILDRVIVNKCAIVQDLIHYLGIKGPADTRLQLDRLLDDGQREMQLFSNLATIQRVTYPAAAYALARSHRVNEAECWVQMLPRELCPPIGRVIKEYCRILRCSQTPRDVHQVLRRIDRYCHAITTTSPSPASSSSASSSLLSSPVGATESVNKRAHESEDEVNDMGERNAAKSLAKKRRYSTQQFSPAVSQSTIVGAMLLVERVIEHYLGVGTSSAVAMRDAFEAQQRQLGLSSVGSLGASPNVSRGGGAPPLGSSTGRGGAFGSTPPILKMGTTPPLGQQRLGSSVGSNGSNGPLGSPSAAPQTTTNIIPLNLTSTSAGTKTLPQDASFDAQRAALMSIADGLVCELTEGRIKTVADLAANGFDHDETTTNTEGKGPAIDGVTLSKKESRSLPKYAVTVSDESSTESEEVAPEKEKEEEENETEKDTSASDKSKSTEENQRGPALPSFGHTSSRPLSPDVVGSPTELSSSSRLPSRRHLLASLSPLFRNHALHVISSYCQRFSTNPSHWQALEHDSRITQLQHRSLQSSAAGQQQQGQGGGSASSRRPFGGGTNSQSPTMRPSTPPKVGLFSGFVKFLFGDDNDKKQEQQQTRASTSSTRYLGRPVDTAPTEGFTLMNTFHLNSSSAGDCQKRMEQKLAVAPSVLLYNFRYMTEGGAVECLSQFHEGGSSPSFVLSHEERENLLTSSPTRVASAAGNINAETLNRPEGLSKHEEAIRVWSMTRAGEVERRLLTPLHISKIKWEMLPDVLAMAEQWASGCAHHSHHEHHEGYLESHGIANDQSEMEKSKHSDNIRHGNGNGNDGDVIVGSQLGKTIRGDDEEDGEVPSRCTRNCCLDTVTPLWVYMQQQAAKYAAEQREKQQQQPFADGAPLASPLPLQSPARLPNVTCKAATSAFPFSVASGTAPTAPIVPHQQNRLTVTNTKTNSKSPFASSSNNNNGANGPNSKATRMPEGSSNSSASFASEVPSCMSTMLLTKEGDPFAKAGDGLMPRLWAVRCMDPSTPYAIAQAAAAAAGSASPTTSEMIDVEVTLRLREEGGMTPSGANKASAAAADGGEDGDSVSETDSTFGDDVANSPKTELIEGADKKSDIMINSSPLSPSPPIATTLPMSPVGAAIVSAAAALEGSGGEEGLIPFFIGSNKMNTKSTTNNQSNNGNTLFAPLGTSFETIHGHPASPEAAAFMVCAAVHLSNASCCHRLASSGHALRSESLSSAFTALSLIDNTLWSLCDVVLGDNAALHLKRALHGAASADFFAGGEGGAAATDSMTSFNNTNDANLGSSFGGNNNNNTNNSSVAGAGVPAIGGFDAFKSFVPSVQLEDSSEAKGLHMASSLNYSSGSGVGKGSNGAGYALRTTSGGDGIVSTQAQKQMLIRKLAANAFLFKSPDTILPMNFRRAIHRRLPPMYQLQDWRNVYSTHHHGVSLSRLLSAAAEEPASILVLKVKPAAEVSRGGRSSGYGFGGGGSRRDDIADNDSEDEEKDESFIIGAFFSSPLKMNSRTYHGSGETFVFRFPPLVSPADAAALLARNKQKRFPNDPSATSPLSLSPSGGATVGTGIDRARHKLEQFRKAARGHPNHFATSHNNSSRKGKKDRGAASGPSSRSSAPPLPRHFEFWHWAHTNEYFVNCKQGEMLAVGGPTPAIYLDESLSRGSTSFCRTFNSPGLTSPPLWVQRQLGPLATADGDLTKDLDVLTVELYGFGWKGAAGGI